MIKMHYLSLKGSINISSLTMWGWSQDVSVAHSEEITLARFILLQTLRSEVSRRECTSGQTQ